jgi:hypothetical protein
MTSLKLLAGTLALTAAMSASSANAVPIVGGTTAVTLTAAPTLTAAGITVAPTGTATATISNGIPTVTFPITGGTQNDSTGALLLNHDGSGLLFTASGNRSLALSNFVVDTAMLTVSGNATANGTAIPGLTPLFNILVNNDLALTSQAAGAINTVFGTSLAAGTVVGNARINAVTAAVPEPGTWAMMLLGFGAVGLTLRRRKPAQTAQAA